MPAIVNTLKVARMKLLQDTIRFYGVNCCRYFMLVALKVGKIAEKSGLCTDKFKPEMQMSEMVQPVHRADRKMLPAQQKQSSRGHIESQKKKQGILDKRCAVEGGGVAEEKQRFFGTFTWMWSCSSNQILCYFGK